MKFPFVCVISGPINYLLFVILLWQRTEISPLYNIVLLVTAALLFVILL